MTLEKTYRTFADIYTGIFEHARQPLTETDLLLKTKRWINCRYLQVQAFRKWRWRKTERAITIHAKYDGTDCDVTNLSRSLIVNDSLTEEVANDWVGRKFYISSKKEIYTINALQSWISISAPTTFILNTPYINATATAQTFKIFQDEYGMWPDFEEFDDVVSFYNQKEVRRVGPAKLMEYFNRSPFMTGKARVLSIVGSKKYEGVKMRDFIMGQDFMGRHLSKKARVFPGIALEDYIIPITFIQRAQSLVEDDDEPLMSMEDRIILYLGGLADMYGSLKDQTEFENYEAKFSAKLEQMADDDQEDDDHPQLSPDFDYRGGTNKIDNLVYDFGTTSDDIITEI